MPKIVLKAKYRGRKDPSIQVSSGPNIRLKKKFYRKRKGGLRKLATKIQMINGETKDTGWVASTEIPVGQILGVTGGVIQSGHYVTSLTPTPSQGAASTQRVGDKIMITGMYNRFQFAQQSNALQPTRGKIIFAVPQFSSYNSVVAGASTGSVETLLNPNPIIGAQSSVAVYDYLCSRQQDYIGDWKIIRTVNFKCGGDSVSGMKGVKTVNANLKFRKPHAVHFAPGTTTVISGDIRVFVLFECGNAGVVVANTTTGLNTNATGVPVKDALSGQLMCYMSKTYYKDS